MEKLDLKDRKILYELDLDARQSFTQIGKKVGLKKDVVAYRVQRMQDEGIIRCFWTAIDTFKLGYDVFRIYIVLQNLSLEKKNEIIQYFVNCKYSWVVGTAKGEVDLNVIVWIRNPYEFYQFWNSTQDLYKDYFAKVTISLYIQAIDFKKSYLSPDAQQEENREHHRITCTRQFVDIDKTDYMLLNELALNARIPLIELSKKLGCSSQNVKYRIDNLSKKGIIKAYRVHLNYSKLGLQIYKLDFYLKDHNQITPMMDYLSKQPYLQCLNVAIGWADIEPEFVVKNMDELNQIIDEINSKFPNSFRRYCLWIMDTIHKERELPEIEFNK
jgi:DNA-binding Lrp family transcriptional regulator